MDWILDCLRWVANRHEEIRNLGLVILATIGLIFARKRISIADNQTKIADEQARIAVANNLAETYTKAIDQLGSEKEAIQLGGLYALEKIAKSNREYHGQIMKVLCGFVRLKARLVNYDESPLPPEEEINIQLKLTAQTALTIIGKREIEFDKFPANIGENIDLTFIKLCNANLLHANLSGANLSRVNLLNAILFGAKLSSTNLSGASLILADLRGAELQCALLQNTNLNKADLSDANLSQAILWNTNLSEADLSGTKLQAANLEHANLTEAKITLEQLQSARAFKSTVLPDHIDPDSLIFQ